MNISIISVFKELYPPFVTTSLVRRAQDKGLVSIDLSSLFEYVAPKERIDSPIFGHGSGMLIRPDVVQAAIEDKEGQHGKAFKIFFSPHGKKLTQKTLRDLSQKIASVDHLMLLPARYEGMDARVEERYADEVISIGDFVLMGGDLPAMVLLEGLLRLMPGVVGKQASIEEESFSGAWVDYPGYTEPVEWQGMRVPDVIRSGNHEAMRVWRQEEAVRRTVLHHFDWLRTCALTDEEKEQAWRVIPPHYVALMHGDVLVGSERQPGTTSVTSIDIHDIARSSATYGIKNMFIVTPLHDQQNIVNTLLDFWKTGTGVDYNRVRHEAVQRVHVLNALEDVIAQITAQEGKRPLIMATSARSAGLHSQQVSFEDQAKVWAAGRPVLLLFGTGQGLSSACIELVDFIMPPITGLTSFNHLSVRSAAAIILDRWLGQK